MSRQFTTRWFRQVSWCFVLLMLFVILLSGCASQNGGPSSTNTPQEMFEAMFAQPIPDNVKDLQGVGDTDQGYSIFLRFRAAAPYWKEDYQEVDCESALQHLELPAGYDRFTPAWSPETVELAVCYQSAGPVSNSWTQNGQHYFLVDAKTLVAYFHGTGD